VEEDIQNNLSTVMFRGTPCMKIKIAESYHSPPTPPHHHHKHSYKTLPAMEEQDQRTTD